MSARKPAPAPPWKRKNPKGKRGGTKLTESQKAWARAEAERAGRPYPNLIDNMRAARLGAAARLEDPMAPQPGASRPKERKGS